MNELMLEPFLCGIVIGILLSMLVCIITPNGNKKVE